MTVHSPFTEGKQRAIKSDRKSRTAVASIAILASDERNGIAIGLL
jgi:hypothetical protein